MKPTVPAVIKDARRKPAFDFDCLTQIPKVAPGTKLFEDFDFETVFRNLDGPQTEPGPDRVKIAQQMGELLRWIVEPPLGERSGLKQIARRAIAMAWAFNPEMRQRLSLASFERLATKHSPTLSQVLPKG